MKCVHCLSILQNRTKDHVFPKNWYPSDTSDKIQRPTVPCCQKCNNWLGGVEDDLFARLAVCIDPQTAEASGINEKLLKSFGLRGEADPKELEKRKFKFRKIVSESSVYDGKVRPFPGMEANLFSWMDKPVITIPIPAKQLHIVCNKIVKGLEFYLNKVYIEKPRRLRNYFAHEDKLSQVNSLFEKHSSKIFYGPGFLVQRLVGESGEILYRITIWGKIVFYSSIQ